MKTVEEWLKELPYPYRDKALRHHKFYNKLGKINCLANALVLAFKWTSTSEGGKYWQDVHKMCMDGKFTKEPVFNRKRYTNKERISDVKQEVYDSLDKALESIYRPFEERKKQIDKLNNN